MLDSTMLFKYPGKHEMHGGKYDYVIVPHDEIDQMIADGWFLTTTEAKAAHEAIRVEDAVAARQAAEAKALADARALISAYEEKASVEEAEDNAPVSKEELQARLNQLGIPFDGRMSVKTLAALIPAAAQ